MEILAPAGGCEAFKGAVNAGADAVYLGGSKYGARAYADNFSQDELLLTIKEAHLMNKKIYLTVNTLTRQSELDDLPEFLYPFAEAGLDGVIVQDAGVLSLIHEQFPELCLHASTQMSVTCPEAVRLLKTLGCRRIVPARELDLSEVAALAREGVEIECFAHGAMCYAYSGRCLFSSFLGGRSGNRGRCAGTCRLPFSILDEKGNPACPSYSYPLSMKDLCVLQILPDLMDAGITSLKIEGRMKKPEYSAGVSAVYRKYADRLYAWDRDGRKTPWSVDEEDLSLLKGLYIRSSVSDGYYKRRNGREMITREKPGYLGADEKYLEYVRKKYLEKPPTVPVPAVFKVTAGEPMELTVPGELTVYGDAAETAKTAPLGEASLKEKLSGRSDSVLVFEDPEILTDGSSFASVRSIKELRRKAIGALEEKRLAAAAETARERSFGKEDADKSSLSLAQDAPPAASGEFAAKGTLILNVTSTAQLKACLGFDNTSLILEPELLYEELPEKGFDGPVYLAFPQIVRASQGKWTGMAMEALKGSRFAGALVRTPESLAMLREARYKGDILLDSSLYIWNDRARDLLLSMGNAAVMNLEQSVHELSRLWTGETLKRAIVPVYGRAPLMISAGCVRKTSGRCPGAGFYYLKDRMNESFPVSICCGKESTLCHNIIYNSVPTSLHAMLEEKTIKNAGALMLKFTDESAASAREITGYFAGILKSGNNAGTKPPFDKFTYGHARKGAE